MTGQVLQGKYDPNQVLAASGTCRMCAITRLETAMARTLRTVLPALALAAGLLGGFVASQAAWAGPDDQDRHDNGKHRGQERGQERREERRDDRDDRREDRRDDRPPAAYYRDDRPHDNGRRAYRSHWGDEWQDDYGVVTTGRCNTQAVLGVMGAVTGGLIANHNASGSDRGIATILGALAGGLIGGAVGSSIDDSDRACIGQSLELVPFGRPVVWVNPRTHISWRVVPIRDVSDRCREFDLYRSRGHERVVACRRGRGDWEFDRR
jgi:surface antigen